MEVLREVIPKFPDVTFYWAGSGNIEHLILGWLGKFPNFKRLGRISYPEEVRDFLSEVDILAQITGSTGQSNPLTPTKNTPKRRLASQSGIADGFGLSKKGSVLRKICIVPLYGWVFLTRIRSGYQVALEPVVHLALQNHCYCHL